MVGCFPATRFQHGGPMAEFRIETLDGGITQLVISGTVKDNDFELFQMISQASKKWSHVLVNLSQLQHWTPRLFSELQAVSARTRIKAISTDQKLVAACNDAGLAVFPTIKSASLSYAGDETLHLLLRKLRDVPILNTEAYRLIAYVSSNDATFPGLEALIKNNPGLVSQILRWANSAYFARQSKAETLQQAMVTLGFSNLRQLFLFNFYTSVGGLFQSQAAVIDHGRACARLAEYICKSAGGTAEECAKVRMGGLLHDVGRMALAFFFPEHYERVAQQMREKNIPSFMAELLVFGTEHQTVGSLLCNRWNFPTYLGAVIGDHHYLQAENWNTLTLPVFVANNFLHEMEGAPFHPYFSKLEGYFFLKRKDLPWKHLDQEFRAFLAQPSDGLI